MFFIDYRVHPQCSSVQWRAGVVSRTFAQAAHPSCLSPGVRALAPAVLRRRTVSRHLLFARRSSCRIRREIEFSTRAQQQQQQSATAVTSITLIVFFLIINIHQSHLQTSPFCWSCSLIVEFASVRARATASCHFMAACLLRIPHHTRLHTWYRTTSHALVGGCAIHR